MNKCAKFQLQTLHIFTLNLNSDVFTPDLGVFDMIFEQMLNLFSFGSAKRTFKTIIMVWIELYIHLKNNIKFYLVLF